MVNLYSTHEELVRLKNQKMSQLAFQNPKGFKIRFEILPKNKESSTFTARWYGILGVPQAQKPATSRVITYN